MPWHKKASQFDQALTPRYDRPPHKNQVNFRPYTEIKSISTTHTEIKSFSTTHATTKSISMPTLKPSYFRPVPKNLLNFDQSHKNPVNRSYPGNKSFGQGASLTIGGPRDRWNYGRFPSYRQPNLVTRIYVYTAVTAKPAFFFVRDQSSMMLTSFWTR